MSVDMFLKLKAGGSDVVGDSTSKIFKGWIEVESFSWGVQTAREAGSGLPTGRRTYKEFRWVNRHQKSSLLIWDALVKNQVIEAEFDVVRASSDGGSEVFFKFFFKGAKISSFDMAGEAEGPMEEIGLVFTSVEGEDPVNGIVVQDTLSTGA